MPDWTLHQQQAIDASGRSIIVSAAAGSGKTAVLIERLIRIISDTENKTNVENMVIVTFTKAAAAEMKQRLADALLKKIALEPNNKWLARQHSFLGLASISTIHSFCFNLIRDNITRFSLSPDFRVIEESEQKLFSQTVMEKLMENLYKEKPDKIRLLCDNFCGNNDRKLMELIPDIYAQISSIPFYEGRINKFYELYEGDDYKKEYLEIFKNTLISYKSSCAEMIKTASGLNDEKISEVLDCDLKIIKNICDYFDKEKFDDLSKYISGKLFITWAKSNKDNLFEKEQLKKKRDNVKEIVNDVKKFMSIYENADEDIKISKDILSVLLEIVIEYDERLYEYKIEKNALGFDDAERIALKLLGDVDEDGNIIKTPLGEEVSQNYKIIMVDEFQDSNDRQDMIFRLLSNNGTAEKYGDNLFFVGDVKQSIYRFRQANPDNFIGVMKSFEAYDKKSKNNTYIKLNENFRSSPEVINFVNYIFGNIMSEKAGDINYNIDEALKNGMKFFEYERDTQVMLINKTDCDDDAEAICVASKIRSMIDEGVLVSDGKGGTRKCEMKDFCILMRNKKLNAVYSDCLEKHGLTANCEDVLGYLKSREIAVLLNVLRVISNPLQDIPVVSVLMSPMFMVTADEITKIKLVNNKKGIYKNISDVLGVSYSYETEEEEVKNVTLEDDPDGVIYKKIENFYNLITEIRFVSAFYSLPEIIQMIYDKTDFMSVIHLYKDADRKRANLRILLEYANNYEAVSGGGIGGFIRYIDKISESKGDFKSVGGESAIQNAVSIKTMHKSKGLEYPFVFITQTDTEFNSEDDKKSYQFSTEKGIGFRVQNKKTFEKSTSVSFEVIKNYNKAKRLGEEMRLLYVALTRAKERLFITMDISEKKAEKAAAYMAEIKASKGRITSQLAGSVNSMNDWLLMCLIAHSKSAKLREVFKIYESFILKIDFGLTNISFENATEYKEYQPITDCNVEKLECDENIIKQLSERFEIEYDDSLADVAAKLSVSDISKSDESELLLLKKPDFEMEEKELTGAERGTALHAFLQFVDFLKLEEDFETEKQRMIDLGYITKKQAKAIKQSDIDAFLNSGLYKKIKNGKIIREKKFLISIDDLGMDDEFSKAYKNTDGMLNGIMDMIIENDDDVILVDYKTDKESSSQKLKEKYTAQLLLYKKALEKIQKKPVTSAIIYSFYQKTEIVVF